MQCPLQFILQSLLTLFFFHVGYANDSGSSEVPIEIQEWHSPPGSERDSFALAQDDAKTPSTKTRSKPEVGTQDESILSRYVSFVFPPKASSASARRVQSQRSAPSYNSNAPLNQLLQHEEEDSSTDSRSSKRALYSFDASKTPSKSNVVTSGNYQNAAYSEKKKQSTTSSVKSLCLECEGYVEYVESGSFGQYEWTCNAPDCKNFRKHMSTSGIDAGKREPGTGGDFKTPSRDSFAFLDRQRQHEEEDFSTSSDEFVAPSNQESSSSVSANQQRKREEDESIASSDEFVCAGCKSYESGDLQRWNCNDPNCQNNGQTLI